MATFTTGRAIAVDGLNETIRGLKKSRKELGRVSTKALKTRTSRIVLPEAQKNWQRQNIKPSVARSAVVPAAGQAWAGIRVRYRDGTHPYGAGVVWGSWRYPQFRPWKGNQFTGNTTFNDYIVGPAVRKRGDEFADGLMDDLEGSIVKAIK